MKKNVAISVQDVGIRFNLNHERVDNLKEFVIKFLRKDLKFNEFWALKDINFEIKKGERLGVLGLNGSGKSTLLKALLGEVKHTGNLSFIGQNDNTYHQPIIGYVPQYLTFDKSTPISVLDLFVFCKKSDSFAL